MRSPRECVCKSGTPSTECQEWRVLEQETMNYEERRGAEIQKYSQKAIIENSVKLNLVSNVSKRV